MKIAFDLDGTLYDTLPGVLEVNREIRGDLGYGDISQEEYKAKFQSKDWSKLYKSLGIKEEDIKGFIREFIKRFNLLDPPTMISGAKQSLQEAEEVLGPKNVYIVSNETTEGIKRRFERDNLTHFLDRVKNPYEGKSEELYKLAISNSEDPFFYVGDLVSDGEDCLEARSKGAENLNFCGIVHSYAMNTEDAIRNFVEENRDFSQILNNLGEVRELWSQ